MTTFPFPAVFVGPLPKNWEKAFGYDGCQRWLAAYWSPYGDEAMMDDGMMSGTAHGAVYLDLVDHRMSLAIDQAEAAMGLEPWALGSSESEATHCLLCDLEKRLIVVASLLPACRFMRQKYVPQSLPELTNAEWEALEKEMERQRQMTLVICRGCLYGYIPTETGYEPCIACDSRGSWFVEVEEAPQFEGDEFDIVWPY